MKKDKEKDEHRTSNIQHRMMKSLAQRTRRARARRGRGACATMFDVHLLIFLVPMLQRGNAYQQRIF